mmetsp:Transcript_49225/g.87903  ORF Transcript_49225/g.87903 Transcript_49225/m.87903 type:complete len:111 (+) Transcript_49225:1161-1493(+)
MDTILGACRTENSSAMQCVPRLGVFNTGFDKWKPFLLDLVLSGQSQATLTTWMATYQCHQKWQMFSVLTEEYLLPISRITSGWFVTGTACNGWGHCCRCCLLLLLAQISP